MRKYIVVLAITMALFSCTNGKPDERKIDNAGDKLKNSVEKGTDSLRSKLGRLKDKLDTTHVDTTRY